MILQITRVYSVNLTEAHEVSLCSSLCEASHLVWNCNVHRCPVSVILRSKRIDHLWISLWSSAWISRKVDFSTVERSSRDSSCNHLYRKVEYVKNCSVILRDRLQLSRELQTPKSIRVLKDDVVWCPSKIRDRWDRKLGLYDSCVWKDTRPRSTEVHRYDIEEGLMLRFSIMINQ